MGIKKLNKYLLNQNSLRKHKNLINFKKSIDKKKRSKRPFNIRNRYFIIFI